MLARDLHFVNLVATIAVGTTPVGRLAHFMTTAARIPTPPTKGLNLSAPAVIRDGLKRAVDSGQLAGAATFSGILAAIGNGETGRPIIISHARATAPEVCLVIHLADGGPLAADDVAGKFYQAYFARK